LRTCTTACASFLLVPAGFSPLARVIPALAEGAQTISLLAPLAQREEFLPYQAYDLLGKAIMKQGRWKETPSLLDGTMSRFGHPPGLPNAAGDFHMKLARVAEALAAEEKSLELNADQPRRRDAAESLKEKR